MVDVVLDRLIKLLHAAEDSVADAVAVMSRNQRSMTFSHELLVGMKCMWNRLCRFSQL